MKFIDLFSGIGGFRMAMEAAGHECVGFCEIDKYAVQSYRAIYDTEGEFYAEDITRVDPDEFPDFDCLTGGFPCQAFSVAGRREGFDDTRGTLFFDIARIAEARRPGLLLLENVKGLLNHDGGRTFRIILTTLDELGYDLEWQVLNSKDFGVPQSRERVFIIGHLRGRGGRQVFPIGGTGQKIDCQQLSDGAGLSHAIDANYHKGLAESQVGKGRRTHVVSYDRKKGIGKELDVAYTLGESDRRGLNRNQKQTAVVETINQIMELDSERDNPQRYRVYDKNGLSPTLGTMQDGGLHPHVVIRAARGRNPDNPSDRTPGTYVEQTFEPAPDGLSNTITTVQKDNLLAIRETEDGFHLARNDEKKSSVQGTHVTYPEGKSHCPSTAHVPMTMENIRIRRLTPRECWRLQGFPDWAFDKAKESGVSDTQLYRQAGNSVTVNVVYEIAKRL